MLMLLLSAVFQAVLYFHALHVARLAADEGLTSAQGVSGSSSAGSDRAKSVLDQFGDPLGGATVDVARGAAQATVHVHGKVASLVPGMTFTVDASVAGPVARFHP